MKDKEIAKQRSCGRVFWVFRTASKIPERALSFLVWSQFFETYFSVWNSSKISVCFWFGFFSYFFLTLIPGSLDFYKFSQEHMHQNIVNLRFLLMEPYQTIVHALLLFIVTLPKIFLCRKI